MVAEPTSAPSAAAVRPVGALIEATFALWQRSWTRTFWFGVVHGLAALLPGVALQGVFSQVALASIALLGGQLLPALPFPLPLPSADPLAVLGSALLRLDTPFTWLLLALSVLGIVASTTLLIAGQGAIVRGEPFGTALRRGLARTPATLGTWLVYTVLVLVAALPFLALLVGAFVAALGGDVVLLTIALVVVLVGGLLASVPLAWASVAFALAPFASALDGSGPIAAQLRSRRLVRGHWWRCATVVSLPLLVYLGAGGTVASLLLMVCGGIAVLRAGWIGLLDPGWLLWSQLLAVPLQAALLPLAFAGGVVMYEDLRPHRAAGA